MSAPPPGRPASLSSTGYEDGFGCRALVFDRVAGGMLERLTLRPEFGAFEAGLRERAARLAGAGDVGLARIRRVHRERPGGSLLVDSDHPSGERLIDVLEAPVEGPVDQAPCGVDVAMGFLLEALPALDALHRGVGMIHGALAPGRLVLASTGRIVLLDAVYGEALERLAWSPARLWKDLQLAVPPHAGPRRFTASMDVSQIVLTALMVLLGRPLRFDEYPAGLTAASAEAVEVAEIHGGSSFASAFSALLGDALPGNPSQAIPSAAEAERCVQALADGAMGRDACRAALRALANSRAHRPAAARPPAAPIVAPPSAQPGISAEPPPVPALELRIELSGTRPPPTVDAPETSAPAPETTASAPETSAPAPQASVLAPETSAPAPQASVLAPETSAPAPQASVLTPETSAPAPQASVLAPETSAPAPPAPVLAAETSPAPQSAPVETSERRRKRGRRRNDTLRSTTSPSKPVPAPVAAPTPEPAPRPAPIPVRPIAPAMPVAPQPVFPQAGIYGGAPPAASPYLAAADRPWAPVPMPVPAPVSSPPDAGRRAGAPIALKSPGLRIKAQSTPRNTAAEEPSLALPYVHRGGREAERPFPWTVAAVGVIVLLVGVAAANRASLLDRFDTAAPAPPVETAPTLPSTGSLVLTSTPAGARVHIDGAFAGETPLTLEGVTPGQRAVTLSSRAGTVRRSIRVDAGQTATLDVPLFSGWLAVDAPIVLEVAQAGRVLGSTQQNRLLLSPGRHTITLTNAELGYRASRVVEIEPGQEHRLSLVPSTAVNLNASPWAEVWIDGKRIGETPIANVSVPLGTRDVVFRHPEFGERRLTPTIKVGDPKAISVDFRQPERP
ncbi:MAG: PEGA domain-containing protein [Acidobacteria bacterium]|nr:PEGA domain-containing protein [Acidobacteriota bacterium]